MKLADFTTLTFDCYGTLIDWESGITAALRPLTERLDEPPARDDVLAAHAVHESAQQRWTPAMPYRALLAVVYRRLAEGWGLPVTEAECEAYGASVGHWPVFADTVDALRYLGAHYRLVILSNVDGRSFAGTQEHLRTDFDAVYTAEAIGSYKPDPRNFAYLLENTARLGIGKGDILHTAESLFHDHGPANAAGLASCWIERRRGKAGFGATMHPGPRPRVDFHFGSLGELAAAHRAEAGGG